eukprot:m.183931 g.183931  ORF g.183931 m.183931 type:complete len:1001 (+) comp32172_c0_seq1:207-3209(+)
MFNCAMARSFGLVALLVQLLVGIGNAYWTEECPNSYFGPLPLAQYNNSDLDCRLKSLALEFGTKAVGLERMNLLGPRLSEALAVDACNGSVQLPWATKPTATSSRANEHVRRSIAVAMVARTGLDAPPLIEIFVSPAGSDATGAGSLSEPYATVTHALGVVKSIPMSKRGPITVWLRGGTYYEQVNLEPDHSGATPATPVVVAAYPGEKVTLSGGTPLTGLKWEPTTIVESNTANTNTGPHVFKAALPSGVSAFTGLFAKGKRLTRARYPNCDDITSTHCYTLNASGEAGVTPNAPLTPIEDIPGGINLEVKNQHGVDMFADLWIAAPATGPNGASDGTLTNGTNATLVVDHPDYAWRCHPDCSWVAQSKWRSFSSDSGPNVSRFDPTFNEQYWPAQVSGSFYFHNTSATESAPGWTPRTWAHPETGVVHMYHTARWGGWQFQLANRNDTDSSLTFACQLLKHVDVDSDNNNTKTNTSTNHETHDHVRYVAEGDVMSPCPRDGSAAIVNGGFQEGRGATIGKFQGNLNNSYFVENIKEELDYPGEWFFDASEGEHGTLYLVPLSGAMPSDDLDLVATQRSRVVTMIGNTSTNPVQNVVLANVTIKHAASTFLNRYEVPSGGDWSLHRGGAVFVDAAVLVSIVGCTFDQVDGNGVFLSRYVRNASVDANNFFAIGETAILVVGAAGKHRTNLGDTNEYPAFNVIERNFVDTVGVWVKQAAAYFKSITRENILRSNIFMNGPRAAVNFNDGGMGGEVMERNLLLNFVRESNDHGPFNSWGRQPYIYRINEHDNQTQPHADGTPRLAISPKTQTIAQNLIFNYNFHGEQCGSVALDHDDASSQYLDEKNVLVYGGIKFFYGMDRVATNNLIIAPGGVEHGFQCFHALTTNRNLSSAHTFYTNNHCILRKGEFPYNCGAGPGAFYNTTHHITLANNTFTWASESEDPGWDQTCACYPGSHTDAPQPCPTKTFNDWQTEGHDIGSKVEYKLSNDEIISEAMALLR